MQQPTPLTRISDTFGTVGTIRAGLRSRDPSVRAAAVKSIPERLPHEEAAALREDLLRALLAEPERDILRDMLAYALSWAYGRREPVDSLSPNGDKVFLEQCRRGRQMGEPPRFFRSRPDSDALTAAPIDTPR